MGNLFAGYFNQMLLLVFLALAAWLGVQAKKLYTKYINTAIKQNVCRTAVRFVEQVFTDIHGAEKLKQAMIKASELLANYGIQISDEELIAMLEAAVNEFSDNFNKKDSEIGGGAHEKKPLDEATQEFVLGVPE